MIDLSQDIYPKEQDRFCIDCQNSKKLNICDECLKWPRERPFWKLKGEKVPEKKKTGLLF